VIRDWVKRMGDRLYEAGWEQSAEYCYRVARWLGVRMEW